MENRPGMTATFRRMTAADQAELAIEQGLAARRWTGTLPSYRTLATALGFSVPTLSEAVRRLVEKGNLAQRKPNRRFQIVGGAATPARRATAGAPARHLIILSPTPSEKWDDGQRRVTLETMQACLADGWTCSQETLDFLKARASLRRWDKVLERHQPTHLLAIHGTRRLAKWARSHGLQVALIGGEAVDADVGVNIGIKLASILGHCAEQLRAAGHRRVLMPCWGGVRELPRFSARILGKTLGLDPARLVAEGWVFGAPSGTPAAHRERLRRHLLSVRPTALIAIDWRDYLVAVECAKDLGLRVPQDFSLIVLNPSVDTEWVRPLAAHYRIDQAFFIREVAGWRKGNPVSSASITQAVLEGWNPGETFGPAKTGDPGIRPD